MDGNLRKLFRDNLPIIHWQSIETGMTGRGIPDSNGCYQGREFWVEFKATSRWSVDLRPEQVGWISRRTRAGGVVFIAVRRLCPGGPRTAAADELWLYPGAVARELKEKGLRGVQPLGLYPGGPPLWPWNTILGVVTQARLSPSPIPPYPT